MGKKYVWLTKYLMSVKEQPPGQMWSFEASLTFSVAIEMYQKNLNNAKIVIAFLLRAPL